MRLNNPKIVIGIVVLSIVIFIFSVAVFPWLMLSFGLSLLPDPPAPQITLGEFPFRLEYEIDGKRIVVEDTLICEYDGIGMDEGQGKFRKWKEHLASGNSEVLLLKINDNKRIYYSVGGANYYMGDIKEGITYNHQFPDASIIETEGTITHDSTIHADELLKKYNIRLISWDYTAPIENTFVSK